MHMPALSVKVRSRGIVMRHRTCCPSLTVIASKSGVPLRFSSRSEIVKQGWPLASVRTDAARSLGGEQQQAAEEQGRNRVHGGFGI
jgi:hypothetical protein